LFKYFPLDKMHSHKLHSRCSTYRKDTFVFFLLLLPIKFLLFPIFDIIALKKYSKSLTHQPSNIHKNIQKNELYFVLFNYRVVCANWNLCVVNKVKVNHIDIYMNDFHTFITRILVWSDWKNDWLCMWSIFLKKKNQYIA
jgi:hypothetical protein